MRTPETGFASLLITLASAVILTAGAAATPSSFHQETINGIVHVFNSSEPAREQMIDEPQEMWRTGTEEDEEDEIMGNITDIKVDAEGRFYLLDAMLNTVKALSRDGEFLRDIGRAGEGPGEWHNGRDLLLMPDGTVGIIRMMPAEIVRLEKDGTPAGTFELPATGGMGMGMIRKAAAGRDHVVLSTLLPKFEDGAVVTTETLASYDDQANTLAVFCHEESRSEGGSFSIQGSDPHNFSTFWAMGGDGRVFVAPLYEGYHIDVYAPDGTRERVIERQYKPVRRSDEDLADLNRQAEELAEMFGGEAQPINSFGRDIREVHARPKGGLWILSSESRRDCPLGVVGLFEEFDEDGRFVRRIGLKVDYDAERDLYVLGDNYLFILKEGQSVPASTSSSSHGPGMMVVTISGGDNDEDEDSDDAPFGVICYRLAD